MRGPDFAGKQSFFFCFLCLFVCLFYFVLFFVSSLDVSLLKSSTNHQQICSWMVVVFLDSTHIAETPSDSNIQGSLGH